MRGEVILSRTNDSWVDKSGYRIVKTLCFGDADVRTAAEAGPFGMDSAPLKGMEAVFSETTVRGESAIVGYYNKQNLAKVGEFRTYSTDESGKLLFYTWMRNGTMEIGGDIDHMVRYSKLEEAFNKLKDDFNKVVQDLNDLKAVFSDWTPVANDGGAALQNKAMTWYGSPLSNNTSDISGAKIEQIKTL